MKQKNIYSKNVLRTIRYFAAIIMLILSTTIAFQTYALFSNNIFQNYTITKKLIVIIQLLSGLTIIVFSVFLLRFPERFFLIGIGNLLFSILTSFTIKSSYMCMILFAVAYATFLIRFNKKKYKKITMLLFLPALIFEFFIPLVTDSENFIEMTMQKICILSALFMVIYFFCECAIQNLVNDNTEEKVLNLANFEGMERSDLYLLQSVLDNKKYKDIAANINGSDGALRNKLSKIYKILEVGDKTGFLTVYSGYKLIYEPAETQNSSSKTKKQK